MRWAVLLALSVSLSWAVDVDPSRRVVPEKFTNPPGKRMNIFSGDPQRIQRANEIRTDDFKATLELARGEWSLEEFKQLADRREPLGITFRVKNGSRRGYSLTFPDAQRYDIMIADSAGKPIYIWSDDKEFVREAGTTFINRREELVYRPNPAVFPHDFVSRMHVGTYTVTMAMSTMPEVKATAELVIHQ